MLADDTVPTTLSRAEAMESEFALLSAEIEAATHRQLTLIRELEHTGLWAMHGATSYTAWLSWRIGLDGATAREKIRVARALAHLPAIDRAFGAARISYSKVRALTRVADATNETTLLDMARHATAAQLERICRGVRRVVRDEHGEEIDAPAPERWVRTRSTDDGMTRLEASLHPDEAARLIKAIELARGIGGASSTTVDAPDALMRIVEVFLADPARERPAAATELVVHVMPTSPSATTSTGGASAEAPHTTLHAQLEDGTRLEPEALRRLGCDAVVQPVMVDRAGLPIDVGRRTRIVRAALRRALDVRDHGTCRFPGCEHRGWIDAHHVEHWIDGGETALGNLISVCSAHHRLLHEGGFSVELRVDGNAVFRDPAGRVIPLAPTLPLASGTRRPPTASAEAPLTDQTLLPAWDGSVPDYHACVAAALPRARHDTPTHH